MLPPAIYEIGARVLATHSPNGPRPLPARVRLRTPSGRWAVIEGARLEGGDEGRVAITLRAAMVDEIVDLLCRAHGLTPRERELVALLLGGLATNRVSDELGISRYTVQDHLKAIFNKTGVRSRRELISHLVGSTHAAISADRPSTPTLSQGSPRRR
jgi:DNA-binding CsgD family transcriptional regulator